MTVSRTLVLAAAHTTGPVRHLSLAAPDGGALASYTPGSHVIVGAGGRANAYSLTGEFLHPQTYEISVLRTPGGTGSHWLHDALGVGDELKVSAPASAFAPVASARHHVLVAGGIGVTPILSHVRAAVRLGRSFEVIYAHRWDPPAHLDDLTVLCGDRLSTVTNRHELTRRLSLRLADQPLGSVVYLCGPAAMMTAVQDLAGALGWPSERILTEAFGVDALDPGDPFTVDLQRSGRRVRVASGVSLLEALESVGIPVPNMCRQGVCGQCRIAVAGGRPRHRDQYLSEAEHAAGDCLMACVSRSHGDLLELSL
jgi:ferredoxin-NADP reductase